MEHDQLLRSLRDKGTHSDLTVVCGDRKFKVHKCIVSSRSEWFAAACRENAWKEGEAGIIEAKAIASDGADEDFTCDDPRAMNLMLDFMYLADHTLDSESEPATVYPNVATPQFKGSLAMHARMYAVGVKYQVPGLTKAAIEKVQKAVRGAWDTEDLAKAIAITFNSTQAGDEGMRDVVINTILSNSAKLVDDSTIQKAVIAVEELGFELFKRKSTENR